MAEQPVPTMTDEEVAEWMRDPAAAINRPARRASRASAYSPPEGWTSFYIALANGSGTKTSRTVQALSRKELAWVARVISAEIKKRKEVEKVPPEC